MERAVGLALEFAAATILRHPILSSITPAPIQNAVETDSLNFMKMQIIGLKIKLQEK